MVNYQNGKIYEIICNITGERYVGSTIQKLCQRIREHKNNALNIKRQSCSSKQIIIKGNYYINLLESYPCNSREELLKKEREWFEKLPNINKVNPYQSKEEKREYLKNYCIDNEDKLKENRSKYQKNNFEILKKKKEEYRNNNLEKVKEQEKQCRIKRIEKKKEYDKNYRINNSNKIKQRKRTLLYKNY